MARNKVIFGSEVIMDISDATVDAAHLLTGKTAYDKSGEKIEGACTFDSDTTDATAVAGEILSGKTAYVNGNKITGEMPNRGAIDSKITTKAQQITVQNGYHDGSGKVSIDSTEQAKIIGANIKAGVSILGVTGTYAGEGATAQAKTATPYTNKDQTILPDSGYDYLSQVTVAKIAYTETPNAAGGITVTIGTVSPS